MRWVKPKVTLIAKTQVIDKAIQEWLNTIGCSQETTKKYSTRFTANKPNEDAAPYMVEAKTPAERLIELAGRRCYMSFEVGMNPNVTKIREDIAEYIDNILKSGHGSVLEHVTFTFAIENVSRVFSGEMNRHRAGVAISEGSMRFIRYEDIPMVETELLTITDEEQANLDKKGFEFKKRQTKLLFKQAFEQDEEIYKTFQEIWKEELAPESKFAMKKHLTSLGRRIIGMGVATGGIWTLNVRALRHVCQMRCSEAAEEEILEVAKQILTIMMQEEKTLFGDFYQDEKGFYGPKYKKV